MYPHTAKFISSQRKEFSETFERAINLGKQLVRQLDLDPGVDTLGRWMAHHVSNQIVEAETASEDAKDEAKKRVFESILGLWAHHTHFSDRTRPLKSFDPILRALSDLDPDSKYPRYMRSRDEELDESNPDSGAVNEWINIAQGVDSVARILVNFSLRQAFECATQEDTEAWLRNGIGFPGDDDIEVVVRFLAEADRDNAKKGKAGQLETMRTRLQKLKAFRDFGEQVEDAYREEIARIEAL